MNFIYLNFRKTTSSHSRCTFPDCGTPNDRLRLINKRTRMKALKTRKLYIPAGARACYRHESEVSWNFNLIRPIQRFNAKQIEEMINLLREPTLGNTLHESVIGPHNAGTMEIYIGLTNEQFETVLQIILQPLIQTYKSEQKSRIAFYLYLMKMKTGHTFAQIAPHFDLSAITICQRIKVVRDIIHTHFVPLYLFTQNRQKIIRHTTPLSRKLFETTNDKLILVWDGTYVFTVKSSNYQFQKETFSMQKKRNLLKVMMCVSTDGYIIGAYGPYEASKNDATILNEILEQQGNIFAAARDGDVIVVDRGFRDIVNTLKRSNFDVAIPENIGEGKTQLTTKQANKSRIVTKTRFIVEVRNGHITSKWKHLNGVKNIESMPYLMQDYQICAAFLNAFSPSIRSDKDDWELVGNNMLEKRDVKNDLLNIVQRIPQASFASVNNLSLFPKLTYEDLKAITQGTYQIVQSPSYCQSHLKDNENKFVVKVCPADVCQKYCGRFLISNSKPLLLLVNFKSRFVSSKKHKTYVLVDLNARGHQIIKAYYCSCKNGARTIGCCSHVTTIIWYTFCIDHTNFTPEILPSSNLNNFFDYIVDPTLSDDDSE